MVHFLRAPNGGTAITLWNIAANRYHIDDMSLASLCGVGYTGLARRSRTPQNFSLGLGPSRLGRVVFLILMTSDRSMGVPRERFLHYTLLLLEDDLYGGRLRKMNNMYVFFLRVKINMGWDG
jgi:hypothetical protein